MRFFLLFSLFIFIIACKNETQPSSESAAEAKDVLSTNQDTISPATFLTWTTNWNNHGKSYTDTLLVKYFSMPLIDLAETLIEMPVSARFYHGLDSLGNGAWEAKLILTGVDANGNDIGQYYDLSKPCPKHCGK